MYRKERQGLSHEAPQLEGFMALSQFLPGFGLQRGLCASSHVDKLLLPEPFAPGICHFPGVVFVPVFYNDAHQCCLTKTRERKAVNLVKCHFYYHVLKEFAEGSNSPLINNGIRTSDQSILKLILFSYIPTIAHFVNKEAAFTPL